MADASQLVDAEGHHLVLYTPEGALHWSKLIIDELAAVVKERLNCANKTKDIWISTLNECVFTFQYVCYPRATC